MGLVEFENQIRTFIAYYNIVTQKVGCSISLIYNRHKIISCLLLVFVYMDETFPNWWMGKTGCLSWPPRIPDDFTLFTLNSWII